MTPAETVTVLHSFAVGEGPAYDALVEGSDGLLYGITPRGTRMGWVRFIGLPRTEPDSPTSTPSATRFASMWGLW